MLWNTVHLKLISNSVTVVHSDPQKKSPRVFSPPSSFVIKISRGSLTLGCDAYQELYPSNFGAKVHSGCSAQQVSTFGWSIYSFSCSACQGSQTSLAIFIHSSHSALEITLFCDSLCFVLGIVNG